MEDSSKFLIKMVLLIAVALALTISFNIPKYNHHNVSLEKECDSPVDYPVCRFTGEAVAQAEPSIANKVLGSLVGVLAIMILTYACWHASVHVSGGEDKQHKDEAKKPEAKKDDRADTKNSKDATSGGKA